VAIVRKDHDPFALGSLIALLMKTARTSETSVHIQLRTQQYIPEDSELQNVHIYYKKIYSIIMSA
jgi:hypothetical protein